MDKSSYKRSQALQIYLKDGIEDEDLLKKIWDSAGSGERRQNVFREMLCAGMIAMLEADKMPEYIVQELGLDIILERKLRRKSRFEAAKRGDVQQAPASPYGYPAPPPAYPQYPYPYPQMPLPAPVYPAYAPAPPEQRPAEAPRAEQRPVQERQEQPAQLSAVPSPAPARSSEPQRPVIVSSTPDEANKPSSEAQKKKHKFDLM